MKRVAIIMTLALVLAGAFALSAQANIINPLTGKIVPNELLNPDFKEYGAHWTTSGTVTFTGNAALLSGEVASLIQVVDDSTSEGWIPTGIGKHINFSAHFDKGQIADIELEAWYYPSNPGTQPIFDGGLGWVSFGSRSLNLVAGNMFDEIDMSAQINGFQPRWIAVEFEADHIIGSFTLNQLDLETYCKIPVPPSLVLLGSGLLGLVGLRFRRNLV